MAYEYKFSQEGCWYLNACSLGGSDECNGTCPRYLEMHYLMFMSNIPPKRQTLAVLYASKEDVNSFLRLKAIGDNIVDCVDNGLSLYIHSANFGNGKTTWAIRLMLKYFNRIWLGNGFKRRGVFVHVPTLLSKLKQFNTKDEYFDRLVIDLAEVDLVVWDDIAATKLSDYDHANLLSILDQRVFARKANIYTGNLGQDEVVNALGNRLASRVWNESEKICFVGNDRRGVL